MSNEIKCTNCGTVFEANESIRNQLSDMRNLGTEMAVLCVTLRTTLNKTE